MRSLIFKIVNRRKRSFDNENDLINSYFYDEKPILAGLRDQKPTINNCNDKITYFVVRVRKHVE